MGYAHSTVNLKVECDYITYVLGLRIISQKVTLAWHIIIIFSLFFFFESVIRDWIATLLFRKIGNDTKTILKALN